MLTFTHVIRFGARCMVDGLPETFGPAADLAKAAGEHEWKVAPAQRVDRNTGATAAGVALVSPTRDWSASITQGSIDCQYQQVLAFGPGGVHPSEPVSYATFLERAGKVLGGIQAHLDVVAHRLAAFQEGGIRVSDPPGQEPACHRLIQIPQMPEGEQPHEWDWRLATRVERSFGGAKEITNTIRGVRRVDMNLGPFETVPALSVIMDINTIPERRKPRYSARDTLAFCDCAKAWHESLSNELLAQMGLANDGTAAN